MSDVKVNIEIKNLAQFKAAMKSSPTIVRPHLVRAINTSVLLVGREAVNLVNNAGIFHAVDTGVMKDSILASGLERASGPRLLGQVGPDTNYAHWVHEGTRYMRARPFMYAAVEAQSTQVDQVFEDELQKALNKIASMT